MGNIIHSILKFLFEIFKIKGVNIFFKIVIFLLTPATLITILLFIDNTFYFSKYFYNKNKLENIEKIYSLLENKNISFENKNYLNELKENIISDNRLIDNITKNMPYKHEEGNKENVNIILYAVSYSWLIILLSTIIIISLFYLSSKKKLSLIGFLLSLLLTIFFSLLLIIGFYVIFEYIKYNTIIYKWNINNYLKNFILSFITYSIGFIVFVIICIDIDDKQNNNKNKEIKSEESN